MIIGNVGSGPVVYYTMTVVIRQVVLAVVVVALCKTGAPFGVVVGVGVGLRWDRSCLLVCAEL